MRSRTAKQMECEAPDRGLRKYSASKEKLHQCVEHFNREDLSFVIHLGDFIDRNFSRSFDQLLPIYDSLDAPGYHVFPVHQAIPGERRGQS